MRRQRYGAAHLVQVLLPSARRMEHDVTVQDDEPRQPGHGEDDQQDENVLGRLCELGQVAESSDQGAVPGTSSPGGR